MQWVMRDELLKLLELSSGAFDQLQHSGHVALAFGAPLPAMRGRYVDLDLVAMAINLGFAQSIGRENSTAIVAKCFTQWASAVAHAEADHTQDFFMAVGLLGWDAAKKRAEFFLVTHGTLDQITKHFREKKLVRFFAVNVSDIIRRIRERAHAAGIDLSRPFLGPPNDPRFDEIWTRAKRECEARIARLRRDKKKLTVAKLRDQQLNIAVASQVNDVDYALAMQEMR